MGIERWDIQYKAHPVWSLVADLRSLLKSHEERVTPENRDHYDRLNMGLSYIAEIGQEPVMVVTGQALSALQQNLVNVQQHVNAWATGSGSNYLVSAAEGYLDAAFDTVRTWPPSKDRYTRGLRAAATDFVTDAQNAIEGIRGKVEGLQNKINELTATTQAGFSELLTEAQGNIQATQAEVEQLRSEVSSTTATVTAQSQRLDQAINSYQTSYSEAEASRSESHQRALEKFAEDTLSATEKARAQSEEALSAQKEAGQRIVDEVAALRDQAVELVNAVGLASTATEYGRYAEQERKSANSWRFGAVSVFACSFLIFLATLLVSHVDEKTPWQFMAVRFGGSLALLAGGVYMAKESSQHRQEERRAKSFQLDLAALDPFIVNLPPEQRESIKAAAASRLFVERGTSDGTSVSEQQSGATTLPDGVTPEALKLLQSLAETFKK
ncbi:hypothetical protein GCM10014715_56690 [Streptomyces spiralis]|uniref:Uncharacterized protein n=1 Tax=Streptomyces spiralis TaxID=66376 RepID=A0A919A9E0_9ACTN|nr:hypothetical protein [Streptomyces spiralis]GHE93044.1 hypothetical protein GCM10014715_56690 [Streptomyces spiralis]